METPRRKFGRLVEALESLVEAEAIGLRSSDFVAVQELQRQAEPIVAALVELGPLVTETAGRDRLNRVLARRQESLDRLATQMESTRSELDALTSTTRRAARVAPAYGSPRSNAGANRFQARG